MIRAATIILSLAAYFHEAAAFVSPSSSVTGVTTSASGHRDGVVGGLHEHHNANVEIVTTDRKSRREFVQDLLKSSIGISLVYGMTSPAYASGGATAGGAYLLSAKQRYNKRVQAGIKSFLTLDARDLGQVNAYFTTPDEGGWEDLSAAGYLLANAFRTSSTKAPDSLPSVKKWKAFAKEIELLKRALAKKDGDKVFAAYKSAEEKLDDYLDAVELPSGVELKQM